MRFRFIVRVVGLVALTSSASFAEDEPEGRTPGSAACRRGWNVFRPEPSSCLEPMDTDRPHKTDSPHTVAAGHAQVELGLAEYAIARWRGASDSSLGLMNNIYKLGLANGWDLQVLNQLGAYGTRSRRFELDSQMLVRSKIRVLDEARAPLSVTLVPAVVAPLKKGGTFEVGGFAFFGRELPFDLDWELNLGALSETDLETGSRHAAPVATTALTRHWGGPLSTFLELYTDTSTADARRWNGTVDGGLLVAIGRDMQADVGAYVGAFGNVPAITPFLGFSARR